MAKIEGIRIRNFRVLRDVTLGRLWWQQPKALPLSPMTAVIGKNGVGKSTLFDAFGFLADCLRLGVEEACDAKGRGGFGRLRSQGAGEPISFEICYREDKGARPITYELSLGLDDSGRPYVQGERLRQGRKGTSRGRPYTFLEMREGRGIVWSGQQEGERIEDKQQELPLQTLLEVLRRGENEGESRSREIVELEDPRRLGIATLGALKQHPRIAAFRRFMEGWYLSYFTPDAARSLPLAGPQKHLNVHGDNLGNVVQFMQREAPKAFGLLLERMAQKIPGVRSIDTKQSDDGRLLLRFNDQGFQDPFFAQQMSDGTLKMFAYLLLLEDPTPPPLLCIEEPENGLYHKLLEALATEFRHHASRSRGGAQVVVTTHQPYFVNALIPEEVWILEKGEDGFSTIRRASQDPLVRGLVDAGLPLGGLWYSDYLDAR